MGSVAGQSPEFRDSSTESTQARGQNLSTPPRRPSLVPPPRRPARPKPSEHAPEDVPEQDSSAVPATQAPSPPDPADPVNAVVPDVPPAPSYPQPIAPPSEPMQYRAIGLVKGVYKPDEGQLNHGNLITEDGAEIDSVLLGRVTSLVKKHLNLDLPHLWVVYPRTRKADEDSTEEADLHLQIVGVWEPETLGLPGEVPVKEELEAAAENDTTADGSVELAAEASPEPAPTVTEATATVEVEAPPEPSTLEIVPPAPASSAPPDGAEAADSPPVDENYFSIRGEIVKYSDDESLIMIKILQGAKRPGDTRKAFRLVIRGQLAGRTVGHFWEFDVRREGTVLMMASSTLIGIVPPKKKKKKTITRKPRGKGAPSRPRPTGSRPQKPVKQRPLGE